MRIYSGAVVGLVVVSALFAGCGSKPQEESVTATGQPTQEESVAAIKMLGGEFSYKFRSLYLGNSDLTTDAGLVHLKGLKGLERLNVAATKVTDAGLVHLKGLKGLESLDLRYTNVTDAGLVHLKGLERLNLAFTKVTDAGLAHLEGLDGLRALN